MYWAKYSMDKLFSMIDLSGDSGTSSSTQLYSIIVHRFKKKIKLYCKKFTKGKKVIK
jgi:hypothetical protein